MEVKKQERGFRREKRKRDGVKEGGGGGRLREWRGKGRWRSVWGGPGCVWTIPKQGPFQNG